MRCETIYMTVYHRETKKVETKSSECHIWDNRKWAEKPKSANQQADNV